jgi:cystathionine gamma-synthase
LSKLPVFELTGAEGAPLVVVLGGISASAHVTATMENPAPGWWDAVVGPNRAVDSTRFRILGLEYRDGGRGSDGRPLRIVSTHDQADALAAVLDTLGVRRARAVIGASYGGMVGLAFAERYSDRLEQLVVISAPHEPHPMSTALRSLQRRIVFLGLDTGSEAEALTLARGLAMTTYRSAREFQSRFDVAPTAVSANDAVFPVEAYLRKHGERFAAQCTPARFLALSLSADLHRVKPRNITTPTLLVAAADDGIVPGEQMQLLAATLGGPNRLVEIPTTRGHDAFLTEPEAIGSLLAYSLSNNETNMTATQRPSPTTLAVRAAIARDGEHGAVVPPIHLTSTFAFERFGRPRTFDYTRSGNPTRSQLADALAELEGGARSVVTNTGMSAVTLVLQLLGPGDVIVVAHDSYGGTQRLVRALGAKSHFTLCFADLTAPSAVEEIVRRKPRMVWVETPSNPLLRITDVRRIAAVAHGIGALVVVDNTFLSPALQQPIALGADIVVHSTTKYLNGHSDVVGGAVVAADNATGEALAWWANCLGVTGAPFDSYLTLRGVRTLHARLAQHLENTRAVVDALCEHEGVRQVYYPGLPTHDGHSIAAAQQRGFGAMVSFEIAGGVDGVRCFTDRLEYFTLAESLGGVESLVAHPATMTHASMDSSARAAAGISDSLVRLSVGIESAADLVHDLTAALDAVALAFNTDSVVEPAGV